MSIKLPTFSFEWKTKGALTSKENEKSKVDNCGLVSDDKVPSLKKKKKTSGKEEEKRKLKTYDDHDDDENREDYVEEIANSKQMKLNADIIQDNFTRASVYEWNNTDVCNFVRSMGFPWQIFEDFQITGQELAELSLAQLSNRFDMSHSESFALREALNEKLYTILIMNELCSFKILKQSSTRGLDNWNYKEHENIRVVPVGICQNIWMKPTSSFFSALARSGNVNNTVENCTLSAKLISLPESIVESRDGKVLYLGPDFSNKLQLYSKSDTTYILKELGVKSSKILQDCEKETKMIQDHFSIKLSNHESSAVKKGSWFHLGTLRDILNNKIQCTFKKEILNSGINRFVAISWKIQISSDSLIRFDRINSARTVIIVSPPIYIDGSKVNLLQTTSCQDSSLNTSCEIASENIQLEKNETVNETPPPPKSTEFPCVEGNVFCNVKRNGVSNSKLSMVESEKSPHRYSAVSNDFNISCKQDHVKYDNIPLGKEADSVKASNLNEGNEIENTFADHLKGSEFESTNVAATSEEYGSEIILETVSQTDSFGSDTASTYIPPDAAIEEVDECLDDDLIYETNNIETLDSYQNNQVLKDSDNEYFETKKNKSNDPNLSSGSSTFTDNYENQDAPRSDPISTLSSEQEKLSIDHTANETFVEDFHKRESSSHLLKSESDLDFASVIRLKNFNTVTSFSPNDSLKSISPIQTNNNKGNDSSFQFDGIPLPFETLINEEIESHEDEFSTMENQEEETKEYPPCTNEAATSSGNDSVAFEFSKSPLLTIPICSLLDEDIPTENPENDFSSCSSNSLNSLTHTEEKKVALPVIQSPDIRSHKLSNVKSKRKNIISTGKVVLPSIVDVGKQAQCENQDSEIEYKLNQSANLFETRNFRESSKSCTFSSQETDLREELISRNTPETESFMIESELSKKIYYNNVPEIIKSPSHENWSSPRTIESDTKRVASNIKTKKSDIDRKRDIRELREFQKVVSDRRSEKIFDSNKKKENNGIETLEKNENPRPQSAYSKKGLILASERPKSAGRNVRTNICYERGGENAINYGQRVETKPQIDSGEGEIPLESLSGVSFSKRAPSIQFKKQEEELRNRQTEQVRFAHLSTEIMKSIEKIKHASHAANSFIDESKIIQQNEEEIKSRALALRLQANSLKDAVRMIKISLRDSNKIELDKFTASNIQKKIDSAWKSLHSFEGKLQKCRKSEE